MSLSTLGTTEAKVAQLMQLYLPVVVDLQRKEPRKKSVGKLNLNAYKLRGIGKEKTREKLLRKKQKDCVERLSINSFGNQVQEKEKVTQVVAHKMSFYEPQVWTYQIW